MLQIKLITLLSTLLAVASAAPSQLLQRGITGDCNSEDIATCQTECTGKQESTVSCFVTSTGSFDCVSLFPFFLAISNTASRVIRMLIVSCRPVNKSSVSLPPCLSYIEYYFFIKTSADCLVYSFVRDVTKLGRARSLLSATCCIEFSLFKEFKLGRLQISI